MCYKCAFAKHRTAKIINIKPKKTKISSNATSNSRKYNRLHHKFFQLILNLTLFRPQCDWHCTASLAHSPCDFAWILFIVVTIFLRVYVCVCVHLKHLHAISIFENVLFPFFSIFNRINFVLILTNCCCSFCAPCIFVYAKQTIKGYAVMWLLTKTFRIKNNTNRFSKRIKKRKSDFFFLNSNLVFFKFFLFWRWEMYLNEIFGVAF